MPVEFTQVLNTPSPEAQAVLQNLPEWVTWLARRYRIEVSLALMNKPAWGKSKPVRPRLPGA